MENSQIDEKRGSVEVQHKPDGEQNSTLQAQTQRRQQQVERTITPRASVYETDDEVVLELEMPGVTRENINVNVDNDELSVSGRRVAPVDEGYEMIYQERLPLSYKRSFVLSDRIDASKIKATADCGVLQVILPKAAQAKPRKITIE